MCATVKTVNIATVAIIAPLQYPYSCGLWSFRRVLAVQAYPCKCSCDSVGVFVVSFPGPFGAVGRACSLG